MHNKQVEFAGADVVTGFMGVMHLALQHVLGKRSIGRRRDGYSLHLFQKPAEEDPEQQLAYALRQVMLKSIAIQAELELKVRLFRCNHFAEDVAYHELALWYTILMLLQM